MTETATTAVALTEGSPGGSGLHVTGLSKRFPAGRRTVTALQDVELHTAEGGLCSLLGPSGCGKSTVQRILAALEDASEGRALVNVRGPAELRSRGDLGIAFQDSALLPWRSVTANIRLPLEWPATRPTRPGSTT